LLLIKDFVNDLITMNDPFVCIIILLGIVFP